jgi:plastocyanin
MTGALPPELAAGQGAMSEFDPDDYVDKAAHLKQPHGISAAWIAMALVAVLFIGLNRFLGGATAVLWQAEPAGEEAVHHIILHRHSFEPPAILVHSEDRIVLNNEDADVHALTVVGHEEILQDEIIEPETSFAFTVPAFLEPGEYDLICTVHREMRARIVMTGTSGAAPPNVFAGKSAEKSAE